MNKYIFLSIFVLLLTLNSCKSNNSQNDSPSITPQVSIQTITYPSFVKSVWNQVIGGTGLIEFDLKDAKDSTSTRIIDSTSLVNISTYSKVLASGIYDIHVNSKDQSKTADTFFRFKAVQNAVTVKGKVAAVLIAASTDGLITIGQSFIQSGTVPTFKSTTDSTTYKLGLINGFYYLYISGGVKGNITFTAKANGQKVTKSLSIVSLNQYNMEVVTGNGAISIVFAPFSYNQVAVGSTALMSLNLSSIFSQFSSAIYFVLTDESGNILNEMKYIPGTTAMKISSLIPFAKDRFNFYQIEIPNDPSAETNIQGYLQIKKGSIYTVNNGAVLPTGTSATGVRMHVSSTASFDRLNVSGDYGGSVTLNSIADTTQLYYIPYTSNSKIFVQQLKNNQSVYNFFDIPSGATNYTIDPTQLTKSSSVQSMSIPGGYLAVTVYAKTILGEELDYNFGDLNPTSNQFNYYYPSESFPEYDTRMSYYLGNFNYLFVNTGTTIASTPTNINASFNITNPSLANFNPTVSGTFDFYHGNFLSRVAGQNLTIDLYSPSAANYTNVKLPDFSKYLGTTLNLNMISLQTFGLYQSSDFNEGRIFYKDAHSYYDINSKAIEQHF